MIFAVLRSQQLLQLVPGLADAVNLAFKGVQEPDAVLALKKYVCKRSYKNRLFSGDVQPLPAIQGIGNGIGRWIDEEAHAA